MIAELLAIKLQLRNPLLVFSQCKFKHSIGSVERRLYRAINRASGDRAAPEHLNISVLESGVHEDRDQVLAESVDVIQVRKRAGEPVRRGFLYRFQSGFGGRFQRSGSIGGFSGIRLKPLSTELERYANAALTGRFLGYFRALKSQTFAIRGD